MVNLEIIRHRYLLVIDRNAYVLSQICKRVSLIVIELISCEKSVKPYPNEIQNTLIIDQLRYL